MFVISTTLKDSLTQQFSKITANVSSLTPRALLQKASGRKDLDQIAQLCQVAHDSLDKERKAVHAKDAESKALKYQLARCYNTTTSLLDVVVAGDATNQDVLDYRQEMSELLAGFVRKVKVLEESNVQKERRLVERAEIIATPGDDKSEIRVKEAAAERQVANDQHDKAVLDKYDRYKSKMPTKDTNSMGNQKLVMFDMPVIPLVQTVLTEDALRSIGLKGDSLGMYTIIQNQRILGVNPKALKAEKQTVEAYVKQVLHNLGERKGGTWSWVTESPAAYRASGLQYIWVMESRKLSRLLKLVHGSIEEWGFPFALKERVMKQSDGKEYRTDTGLKPKVNVPQKWSEHKDSDGKINTLRDGTHQNPRKDFTPIPD